MNQKGEIIDLALHVGAIRIYCGSLSVVKVVAITEIPVIISWI